MNTIKNSNDGAVYLVNISTEQIQAKTNKKKTREMSKMSASYRNAKPTPKTSADIGGRTELVLCLGWNVRLIVSLPRRYGVMTLRYNRRTASQPSHVVRQNLQKRKLRVLNPARINVFYWFNWLNLIGS